MRPDSPLKLRAAIRQGSGEHCEDRIFTLPFATIVLDGASQLKRLERSGGWLADELGTRLVEALEADPTIDLLLALRRCNQDLIRFHDLRRGEAPSTTVNIVRWNTKTVDVLVLCDSPVAILHTDNTVDLVRDDRLDASVAQLTKPSTRRDYSQPAWQQYHAEVEALRNTDQGFWCISSSLIAPDKSILRSYPRQTVQAAMAVTDGVAIGIDRYGLMNWRTAIEIAIDEPDKLIELVHESELQDRACTQWPRTKTHDDKAIAASSSRAINHGHTAVIPYR